MEVTPPICLTFFGAYLVLCRGSFIVQSLVCRLYILCRERLCDGGFFPSRLHMLSDGSTFKAWCVGCPMMSGRRECDMWYFNNGTFWSIVMAGKWSSICGGFTMCVREYCRGVQSPSLVFLDAFNAYKCFPWPQGRSVKFSRVLCWWCRSLVRLSLGS